MNRIRDLARLLIGGMMGIVIGACGSAPPPAAAPEPEPIEEEELVEEPDPAISSRVLIEARVREPFGVQSAGQLPSRVPRTGAVVVDGRADPDRRIELTVVSAGPASDEETEPLEEAEVETQPEPQPRAPATTGRTVPAPPPAAPRTHTVQSGETFFSIARRHNVTPMALAAANPGVDINRIRSGQVLRLPQTGNNPAPATARTHRVQAGETLWSISRRYGVTPTQIRQANRMTDDTVRVGEALVIP